ncbi:MAG: hypothetical protein AB7F86_03420 [Bdellovibrionales bacterium]
MKFFHYFIVSGILLGTIGCNGGGGGRRALGGQCAAQNNPVPMDPAPSQQKLSLKPEDVKSLPEGVFEYDHATVYFIDKATDLRVQFTEAKDKSGKMTANINCVRNAKPGIDLGVSLSGVTRIDVQVGGKTLVDIQTFTFYVDASKYKVATKSEATGKAESPSETYERVGEKASREYFMVRLNDSNTDYEIRSHFKDDKGEYWISTTFKRRDHTHAESLVDTYL